MTLAVVGSEVPLTATCPPLVIVHLLPLASIIVPVVPITAVSFGEGVGVGVGVGVGAGVGVGVAGNGLVLVPGVGDQAAVGLVFPHHRLLAFSCQTVPFT